MTFEEMIGRVKDREPVEVFHDGRWVRATCSKYTFGYGPSGMLGGYAIFIPLDLPRDVAMHYNVVRELPRIKVGAGEFPQRVRVPLEGRALTADEIDRYASEVKEVAAVPADYLKALIRTAKDGAAELEKGRKFRSAVAVALGFVPVEKGPPPDDQIVERARESRPSTFFWRTQAASYQKEIDELKKDLHVAEVNLAHMVKSRDECARARDDERQRVVELDATASRYACKLRQVEELAKKLRQIEDIVK